MQSEAISGAVILGSLKGARKSYGPVIAPAFYLHQLVLAAVGAKTSMVGGALTHVAILLGATALCLALSARRLKRVG